MWGTPKLWLIALGVGVLLFLSIWAYRKLKKVWYRKGLDDANSDCNKRIMEMYHVLDSGKFPNGMSDSGKTWAVSSNATPDRVESPDSDGSGQQARTGKVPDQS